MKKSTYNVLVDKIVGSMIAWCEANKVDIYSNGEYCCYMKMKNDVKLQDKVSALFSYIMENVGLTKKKLQKMIDLAHFKDRLYVLFKVQVCTY